MSANLDRKRCRQAGLRVYRKSILGEINSCILDDGSEQAKLVGFKASVLTVVEQLTAIHEKILALIDPAEIEKEVLEHMKLLQPSYKILARADLKIAKFSENIVNAGPNQCSHNLGKFPQIFAVSMGVVLGIMRILCIPFKILLLGNCSANSQPPSPSRNNDMEISCDSAGPNSNLFK